MSRGQRQRVAIARSLVCNPRLVLADEPTGALDTANGDALVALMRRLNQERAVTFVIVTHDLDLAARTIELSVSAMGEWPQTGCAVEEIRLAL